MDRQKTQHNYLSDPGAKMRRRPCATRTVRAARLGALALSSQGRPQRGLGGAGRPHCKGQAARSWAGGGEGEGMWGLAGQSSWSEDINWGGEI